MLTNYSLNTCSYSIDKLEKVVYLIKKEFIGEINPSEYYIDSAANANVITCNSVTLNESMSLDERYQFTHTLQFQVNGYMTEENFNDRYYAVVKDKNGVYYLVNPEFKMKPTYTYTLDGNGEYTDFQLSTISNYPLMRINNFAPWASANFTQDGVMYRWVTVTPSSTNRNTYICDYGSDEWECKEDNYCPLDTIQLNEKAYTVFCDDGIHCSNGGFVNVDFEKGSASITETYDGNNIVHTVKFSIPYENSTWHNFLMDFNNNKYCALVKARCGKNVACGFEFGLMPSYSLEGSSSERDKIDITLQAINDGGRLIYDKQDIPIIVEEN